MSDEVKPIYRPFYASVILINSLGEVLLGKRKEDGKITPPGGSSNEGESPEDTAIRETFEECGIALDRRLLKPLPSIVVGNGRTCYCFLYIAAPGKTTTSKLDPDQEVGKWIWYPKDKIPDGLRDDNNRFTSVLNAYMAFSGILKSLENALLSKGGEGSGIKGHMTAKDLTSNINQLADKLIQINPYRDLLSKLKNAAVMEGVELRSGKPLFLNPDQSLAQGYEPEDYREASNIHYDKAEQMQKQVDKFRKLGRKYPKEMDQIVAFHMNHFKTNYRMAAKIEKRRSAVEEHLKERNKVNKAVTMMAHHDAAEIDTSKFANENTNLPEFDWLTHLQERMENYQYGNEPVNVLLDRGWLSLVKVDDGMYSGYFTNLTDVDGEDQVMLDNAKVRMERMTLPSLVQFCIAKEWIRTKPLEEPIVEPVAEPAQIVEVLPPEPDKLSVSERLEILRLIDRLTSP